MAGSTGETYGRQTAHIQHVEAFEITEYGRQPGMVIALPLVNLPSFEQKIPHVNPVDGKSMNRFYPGKPDGTQTERASWLITKQVVERCDYLIEYHGGDLDENLRPYSSWPKTGNDRQDAITRVVS